MKIGILAIGDELLSGRVQDTNSRTLAKLFFKEGMSVSMFRACSDLDIEKHVKELMTQCDLVVTSGGLGPTHDDMTAESVAKAFGVGLESSQEVIKDLTIRHTDHFFEIEGVARIPQNAKPLLNFVGSAPGFIIDGDMGRCLIALPGVPYELEALAKAYLPAIIKQRRSKTTNVFSKAMHFCHVGEDSIAPTVTNLTMAFPNLEFGIYPDISTVSVTFRGEAESEDAFNQETQEVVETFYEQFSTLVYPSNKGSVVDAVLSELKRRKKTVALAESCTGGEMAASLTKIPGASEVFLLGVVAYSDEAKHQVLHVPNKVLTTYGAVSEQVVIEMINGLFEISKADFAIAVSGIAGPDGGTVEKPVGTVWGALAMRGGKIYTGLIPNHRGMTRDVIIKKSTNYLFGALWRHIAYDICPFT